MKKILIVDDEIQILKSLTRMFMDTDYTIFTAQNSNDALNIIESESIDMIIVICGCPSSTATSF